MLFNALLKTLSRGEPNYPSGEIRYTFAKAGFSVRDETHFTLEGDPLVFNARNWSETQKERIRDSLDMYEDYIDVSFTETDSVRESDVEFVNNRNGIDLGFAGKNARTDNLYIAFEAEQSLIEEGSFEYFVFIHEMGHILGLDHPYSQGSTTILPGSVDASFNLDDGAFGLNNRLYTTQSTFPSGGAAEDFEQPASNFAEVGLPNPFTIMAIDVGVLQFLYGENQNHNAGPTRYVFDDGDGFSSIWDTGGVDKIVYKGDEAVTIQLREATLKLNNGGGGYLSYNFFGDEVNESEELAGFSIANGARIENANGASGSDLIIGNGLRNKLKGKGGDDTLKGLGGDDTLIGSRGDDSVIGGGGRDVIVGGNGDDTLRGGGGDDVFRFTASSGHDLIKRFKDGDLLDFRGDVDMAAIEVETGNFGSRLVFGEASVTLRGFEVDAIDDLLI